MHGAPAGRAPPPTNIIEPRQWGLPRSHLLKCKHRATPWGQTFGRRWALNDKDTARTFSENDPPAGPPAWRESLPEKGPVQARGGPDDGEALPSARGTRWPSGPPGRAAARGSPRPPEAAGGLARSGGGGLGRGGRGRGRGARRLGLLGGRGRRGRRALEVVEQLHLRVAGRVQRQELHGLLQAPRVALAVVLVQALGAGGGGGEGCGESGRR